MASSPITHPSSPSRSDDVLTPTRKVQALLSRFDDSDSEHSTPSPGVKAVQDRRTDRSSSRTSSKSGEDEDDLPPVRPSRMAARLQGNRPTTFRASVDADGSLAQPAEQPMIQDGQLKVGQENDNATSKPAETSEDELTRPAPRRRLLLKRKTSPAPPSSPAENRSQPPPRSLSPSPSTDTATRPSRSPGSRDVASTLSDNSSQVTGSKFKALVAKHRKARLEKEAAEMAKRAVAGKSGEHNSDQPRKQRGSSPADDSDEGSDESNVGAARRLTKDAKPTRKASKKAMEEMKRETQRMSRNMQLAHQARTKKKITKESLLARFNFPVPTINTETQAADDQSGTASSEIGSDSEQQKRHETPPTSPLQDPVNDAKPIHQQALEDTDKAMTDAGDVVVEAPPLKDLGLDVTTDLNKGKGKAADWMRPDQVEVRQVSTEQPAMPTMTTNQPRAGKLDVRARVTELLRSQQANRDNEDEDDLDVITKRGSMRKYAVFERLPKRKAQETQSHLTLRSLAHLHDSERNSRSSMTSSEMDASLRKAARMQAREERQQKIAELKAKGVVIQTAEERERDQQEVEDLVERARQEAAEISKREKELAKKNGTFEKDDLDDDDESGDEEFEDEIEEGLGDDSEVESEETEEDDEEDAPADDSGQLIDEAADEADTEEDTEEQSDANPEDALSDTAEDEDPVQQTPAPRKSRIARVVVDEDDAPEPAAIASPALPQPAKTPQSILRSARKQIPGLQMSDDLPLGLTQAFAATMADSQSQDEEQTQHQDSLSVIRDLPSPNISMVPKLNRLESLDMVSDSQPASQVQPLNISLSFSQSQKIPESPSLGRESTAIQFTPSQLPFEPTQDGGYMFSPFHGNRFASETPQQPAPHSTLDTVIVPGAVDASPILQRKGRLQRGRAQLADSDDEAEATPKFDKSAFELMRRAAKKHDQPDFDKSKSNARAVVDEAAEESDDEYAGLGGASDDDGNDEENDDDREMIDHDTQVGKGDEAKLAGLFADRERKNDEAAVSKLLKDITTGALRRKRGANDDLDLSDEEDAVARRREAKRREFAKMRRELLKDEAVGKIAEDKKKEAFLRSIEDRELVSDDDDIDQPELRLEVSADQSQQEQPPPQGDSNEIPGTQRKRPLEPASDSQLNLLPPSLRRAPHKHKPTTLAEIRESVSFLIEEPDSQAGTIDLGLSDSESEPEAYVNLDRHLKTAEADENAALDEDEDDDDLDDFIIDDDGLGKEGIQHRPSSQDPLFKKPSLPLQTTQSGFAERRSRPNVVNRLSLLRQSSSASSSSNSSSTNTNTKLAFHSTTTSSTTPGFKVPTLLRRATTNSSFSSLSSLSSSDKVSATGVTTSSRTERGHVSEEKEFIRKGTGGRRNAVNYRPTVKEERMSARAGVQKALRRGKGKGNGNAGKSGGFLGGLFRGDSWG